MAIKDPLTKDLKEYNYPPTPALLLFMKNEGKDSDKYFYLTLGLKLLIIKEN